MYTCTVQKHLKTPVNKSKSAHVKGERTPDISDLQAVAVRRHQCESIDADPLVWTNQRFIRWARNIDLGEYAENLKGR